MVKVAIGTGIVLSALGIIGYAASGAASVTALIPAAFGIVFILLGILARKETLRRHAMHAAAALSLLGIVGTAGGTASALRMMGGATVERPEAAVAQAVMALVCAVFLILAVRSFINARRSQNQQ